MVLQLFKYLFRKENVRENHYILHLCSSLSISIYRTKSHGFVSCQQVPSHRITANPQEHSERTGPSGSGIHTHPRAARELPEAWLAALVWLSPLHSPGTPRGLGAAARAPCWECLSRCSSLRHRQALSACRSGGRSSVAWSARRQRVQLFRSNTLAVPK